jgi:hypothetical protein
VHLKKLERGKTQKPTASQIVFNTAASFMHRCTNTERGGAAPVCCTPFRNCHFVLLIETNPHITPKKKMRERGGQESTATTTTSKKSHPLCHHFYESFRSFMKTLKQEKKTNLHCIISSNCTDINYTITKGDKKALQCERLIR